MVSESERYVIAFNGEIYNHARLRAELLSQGRRFRGHSDTEVLLAMVETVGLKQALERSIGMFAIAIWDRRTRVLQLARDRFGEKPLYYGWHGGRFLFGSELKALMMHPAFVRTLNTRAVSLLLRYGYIPAPHSIFANTWKVPQGSILSLRMPPETEELAPERCPHGLDTYWSSDEVVKKGREHPFTGSFRDATEELTALLKDAVRLQMQADVPLGAFLSGGIDSSTVVALMQAQSARPIKTYAVGFQVQRFNEAEHARAVAAHLGTEHADIYVSSRDCLEALPTLPDVYDEPLGDSSQIPTLLLARLARRDVTVALSGDGGDEIFGGYPRYLLGLRLSRLPMRSTIAELARLLPASVATVFGMVASAIAGRRDGAARIRRYCELLSMATDGSLVERLRYKFAPPADLHAGSTAMDGESEAATPPQISEYCSRAMAHDRTTYLPDDILVKTDRACMAVGLEGRAPLLDHRVAEFSSRLSLDFLIDRRIQKRILREVLYRHVPRSLVDRPKLGFTLPVTDWFRSELREALHCAIEDASVESELGLNRPALRRILNDHVSGRAERSDLLWAAWSLIQWNKSARA